MTYSDEQLQAYLFGELDAEQTQQLEADVAKSPDLEARLMALDPMAAMVKNAFDSVEAEQRVADMGDILAVSEPKRAGGGYWQMAAAAAFAGFIGFGAASYFGDTDPNWREQVANYQSLYVADTVAPIIPTQASLTAQFERAAKALNRSLDADSVDIFEDHELKRAQILAFGDAPLVQVAYAAHDGTPIAFCIVRLNGEDSDLAYETLAGLTSAHWARDGYGYMVIGGTDPNVLKPLAEKLSQVF